MTEIKTELNYSRYDKMCLKVSDFFEKIGGFIKDIWGNISCWCEDHHRFCWTMFVGTVLAIVIALFAGNQGEEAVFGAGERIGYMRHYFSWLYCFVAGGIAEVVTVLIGIIMLFCDRAEVLYFENHYRSYKATDSQEE